MIAFATASRRMVLGFASALLLSGAAHGQTADLSKLLKGIENRYNSTQTLEVGFTESYTMKGHKRAQSGTLFLRKPGRMRWQYTMPEGRLFLSDGQYFYDYDPDENRVEKMKMKEADDLRAPLAFLLGKLNFSQDFREFHSSPQGDDTLITAIPKSDKLPYTEVTFVASPEFEIKHLTVKDQGGAVLEFGFTGEKRNPPMPDSMFKFTMPPGVELVDSTRGN